MEIIETRRGSVLSLKLVGRLDTTTAPQLENVILKMAGVTELLLDFADVEYVSSAGLRVLLMAQKTMNTLGTMVLTHVKNEVQEIFDITGFSDVLTVKKD